MCANNTAMVILCAVKIQLAHCLSPEQHTQTENMTDLNVE